MLDNQKIIQSQSQASNLNLNQILNLLIKPIRSIFLMNCDIILLKIYERRGTQAWAQAQHNEAQIETNPEPSPI